MAPPRITATVNQSDAQPALRYQRSVMVETLPGRGPSRSGRRQAGDPIPLPVDRLLMRLLGLAVLIGLAWKVNELMTVRRDIRTPEVPQS